MISKILLVMAALVLAVGGVMHARAFAGTDAAVAASNLPAFYGNSLKALWLADSAILLILAALYGVVAVRPALASRTVVVLTALIPAATAACLYVFLGKFFAAHMLMGAGVMVVVAATLLPRSVARSSGLSSL